MKPLSRLFSFWELRRAERRVETLIRQQASTFSVMEAVEVAARLSEQIRSEYSTLTFAWLQVLGNYYRETGSPKAESCLRRALRIGRHILPSLDPRLSIALSNLAWICRLLGRFDEAESYYREALSIDTLVYGRFHPETLASMNNLGILLHQRNDPARNDQAEARTLLEHICQADAKLYPPIHPIIAEDRISWASSVLISEGDWGGAELEIRQALEIYEAVCPHMTIKIASILSTLATVLSAQGEGFQSEALKLYQRALVIDEGEFGPNHPDVATDLCSIAIIQARRGLAQEAFASMERACQIDNQVIAQVFSISSAAQRLIYALAFRQRLDALLSLMSQYLPDSHPAKCAALEVVLRRKAVVAESVAAERDVVMTGRYPALKTKLQELATLRSEIAQMTLAGSLTKGVVSHQRRLKELTSQKERIEAGLAQQVSELDREQRLRSIDRRVVAMAMPVGVTLIEFVRFDVFDFKALPARKESQWKPARYLAFVLPAGELDEVEMIDLGEAESIDRMIATFRFNITGEEYESGKRGLGALPSSARQVTSKDVGAQLREAILTPLLKGLGNRKRLMISPDGDLSRLPFEVLPTDDGRRLIDEYRISYLGAGRDVVRFGFKSNREPSRSLVAADPDFDLGTKAVRAEVSAGAGCRSRDLKREAFERLPGTRREGENIAAMLDADLWTDGEALDARLKECQSPRILHLATHGFFLEDQKRDPNEDRLPFGAMSFGESGTARLMGSHLENPLLRSGLALAGVNTWLEKGELMEEAEDGLLTAEDVSGLDLLDTELVVLSACDTGLGEVRVGEGVFGLRRAFVLAGAKTLVMSLWKVPDEQTRELMEDFYRRILGADGQPPQSRTDALREAQLAMKAKHPEPLYWGAFICQGDPSPLPRL